MTPANNGLHKAAAPWKQSAHMAGDRFTAFDRSAILRIWPPRAWRKFHGGKESGKKKWRPIDGTLNHFDCGAAAGRPLRVAPKAAALQETQAVEVSCSRSSRSNRSVGACTHG